MPNEGKVFEKNFKDSCVRQGIWVYRIPDTYIPLNKIDKNTFVPRNPADFLVHYNGVLFLFELKETQYNYITIEHDGKNGQIKQHQINSLKKLQADHEKGFFIFLFSKSGHAWALNIDNFLEVINATGKHSINELDVVQGGGIPLESTLLRTNHFYNIKDLLERTCK